MGEQFFRAYIDQEGASVEPGSPIRFVASSEGIKRDGMNLKMSGARLDNYKRNPIVTWAHDIFGNRLPIGRGEAFVEMDQMMVDIRFDPEDEFARQVEGKYRRGYLNAVSVNWISLRTEGRDVTDWELLEIAAVPIPGDPEALMKRMGVMAELDSTIDSDDLDGGHAWEATAIGMMRLFHPAAGTLSNRERKAIYNRLAANYRRMGKIAPEYLKAEELDGLGLEELRGLFLEDEPEMIPGWFSEERAGAVLNARNKGDLEEAVRLIGSVLERAVPAKEEERDLTPQPPSRSGKGEEERGNEERELSSALERIGKLLPRNNSSVKP